MNLYQINTQIMELIDTQTGEITDFTAFEQLAVEKNEKIENIALTIKNLQSSAEAIGAERKALAEREKQAISKAESLKGYLDYILDGGQFESPRVKLSYTKSKATVVHPGFVDWAKEHYPELLNTKEPEPNKTKIKETILAGEQVQFAEIAENRNLQIK